MYTVRRRRRYYADVYGTCDRHVFEYALSETLKVSSMYHIR